MHCNFLIQLFSKKLLVQLYAVRRYTRTEAGRIRNPD